MSETKGLYIIPARHNGKSLMQYEMYKTMFEGEQNMNFKEAANRFFGANDPLIRDDRINVNFDPMALKPIQIDDNPETMVPPEEWIWVKGYKGTDRNMCCRDTQYALGRQFDIDNGDSVAVCEHGFHFCKDLSSVFAFYDIGDGNRFFEVEALVKKSDFCDSVNTFTVTTNPYAVRPSTYRPYSRGDKYAGRAIRFIRELTPDEVFARHPARIGHDIKNWSKEQKRRAMETSIDTVRSESRLENLINAGYSEPFARYIAGNRKRCEIAMAVASQPGLSMDVKVMAIFMDRRD